MPIVIDTIPSLHTAPKVAYQSQLEPEVIINTQLEKAVAQKVSPFVQPPLVARCDSDLHLPNDCTMVQFSGLYVVRGPTAPKHMHYTMDITVAEVQLRARCIQRFHSFFLLRKRLLKILKSCHGRLPSCKSPMDEFSAGTGLVQLLTRPLSVQCHECEATYHQLASVKFPHRTLLPPSLQDVQERSQLLETFLDYCVRFATTWSSCQRRKRMFVTTLGAFLGVDLMTHLANQKEVGVVSEARTVVCVSNTTNDVAKVKTNAGVFLVPFLQDASEQADEREDDRHSEPNFSFISDPSKEKNDMVRSKSHR